MSPVLEALEEERPWLAYMEQAALRSRAGVDTRQDEIAKTKAVIAHLEAQLSHHA